MAQTTPMDGASIQGGRMPFELGEMVEVAAKTSGYHGRIGKVSKFCKNGSTKMVYVIFNAEYGTEGEKRIYTKSLRKFNEGVKSVPKGTYAKGHNCIVLDALEVLQDICRDLKDTKVDTKTEDRLLHLTNLVRSLMIEDIDADVHA